MCCITCKYLCVNLFTASRCCSHSKNLLAANNNKTLTHTHWQQHNTIFPGWMEICNVFSALSDWMSTGIRKCDANTHTQIMATKQNCASKKNTSTTTTTIMETVEGYLHSAAFNPISFRNIPIVSAAAAAARDNALNLGAFFQHSPPFSVTI